MVRKATVPSQRERMNDSVLWRSAALKRWNVGTLERWSVGASKRTISRRVVFRDIGHVLILSFISTQLCWSAAGICRNHDHVLEVRLGLG